MRGYLYFGVVAVLCVAPLTGTGHCQPPATAHRQSADLELFATGTIQWQPGPPSLPKGAWIAVLEGNPTKEGPFVFRLKLPDGYRVPPHTHPKSERVTVISG